MQSVRDLGVYFDNRRSIQTHVAKVTQTCFFQLRRLRQIRRLLGRDVTAIVVAALVLTRLDYCNALLDHCTAAARHQCCYETGVRSSAEGPRHRRHHRAALATDPCPDTFLAVYLLVHRALKGQSPSYVAELLQPVTTRTNSSDIAERPRDACSTSCCTN